MVSYHIIPYPLDFIARLAALVPKPRVNLIRFHGVFAPNSQYRARVMPAKRGKGSKRPSKGGSDEQTPAECRASMTWVQRLKLVFGIDIETCRACGSAVRIIACIEDPVVIKEILTHLEKKERVGRSPSAAALSGAATVGLVRLKCRQSRDQRHWLRHQRTLHDCMDAPEGSALGVQEVEQCMEQLPKVAVGLIAGNDRKNAPAYERFPGSGG